MARDLVMHANLAPRVENDARARELREANRALSEALARQADTEQALRERQAELDAVIEQARDAYICTDEQNIVIGWNRQAEKMFGWSRNEALGRSMFDLMIPAEVAPMIREDIRRFADIGKSDMMDQTVEISAVRKDGQRIIAELQVSRLEVNGRTLTCGFAQDISARKANEARLAFEALHDALTGLPNRRALLEALPAAQARAQHGVHTMALLFIDLDGFKAVNDGLGHDAGDALLRTVATRLSASVRSTDRVFRLAGDEFTVILEDLQNGLEDAVRVADKLVAVLSEPAPVGHGVARIGASIGVALHAAGGASTVQDLVNEADGWMYRAKQAGRGQVLPRPAFGTER
jgi:diguanylate cyclase (GGDEF)-like protein/PAS domain S-box-containing protein